MTRVDATSSPPDWFKDARSSAFVEAATTAIQRAEISGASGDQRNTLGLMHDQLSRLQAKGRTPRHPHIRLVPDEVPWVAEAIEAARRATRAPPAAPLTEHADSLRGAQAAALELIGRKIDAYQSQGGTPGYLAEPRADGSRWSFASTSLAHWTGPELGLLYEATGRTLKPISCLGPCDTCQWAVRVQGNSPLGRGHNTPCMSCKRPSHDLYLHGECVRRGGDCNGGLFRLPDRSLVCLAHALPFLPDSGVQGIDYAVRASARLRSMQDGALPTVQWLAQQVAEHQGG